MHAEAYEGFGWALEAAGVDRHEFLDVLDIGGQNVNGSVHDYFTNAKVTTLDLENADIIADARTWQADREYDVVIATEVFEHVREWPQVLRTMRHAGGVALMTCASELRNPHGATGAPLPAPGEYYCNVTKTRLEAVLSQLYGSYELRYQYPPGDVYAWARP